MNPIDAYAQAVAGGHWPAGKYHRLACTRHLRDRGREARDSNFPYRFEYALADRFIRFAGQLRHYKGKDWAGQRIALQPYQQFRLGSLFAWVHRRTGLRRFRTAYNEIPRKNGKSLEAAIVALYVTFFDGEPGGEGYCIATKRDQAKIVFNDCKKLVVSSGLRSRVAVRNLNLHREHTASKLEPLGADYDSADGLNPNLIIADEFHAYKARWLLDVMETATGARAQPMNFQITTAGFDLRSPCGEQHEYATKILTQAIIDETFFAFIAHADDDDDPWAEGTWRKANPNYGVSVVPDDLRALATKAQNLPSAAPAFKQKRLNLWVNTLAPWLSAEGWQRGQSTWTAEDMRGQPCYAGLDLSSKIDLTALVLLFPPTDARPSWRVISRGLTPEDTLDERAARDHAPYRQWVGPGWLRTNPGNRIDQNIVRAMVLEAAQEFAIQGIAIDPYNAGNLINELLADGFDVVEVPQKMMQMSAPAKDFEADVLDGLIDAGGDELFAWCVSNVMVRRDDNDNVYPTKRRSRGRIDPVIAALMARKLATQSSPTAEDPELIVA